MVFLVWRDDKTVSAKWYRFLAIDLETRDKATIVKIHDVLGGKLRVEILLEQIAVIGTDTEHNHRADVAEDGIFDRGRHLCGVLVGDGEV